MSRKTALTALVTCAFSLLLTPLQAQQSSVTPVFGVLRHGTASPPLPELPLVLARGQGPRVVPLRSTPHGPASTQQDTVVQSTVGPLVGTTDLLNFEGVGEGLSGYNVNVAPPDTNGAVGPSHYIQWVNLDFAIFDKSGNMVFGPEPGNYFWQGSSLPQCEVTNDGDPIVFYDQLAGRWVVSQLQYSLGPPYDICIAVSSGSDPTTANWYRYALEWSSDLPDYPKMSVWPDGYYVTTNLFLLGLFFDGAQACALERSKMLLNQDATVQCSSPDASHPSMLPANLDGSTLPPAGAPNYIMNFGTNSLNLWRFHVDWANPANSSFTGPVSVQGVAAFSPACNGGTCIPQPGTSQQLDSLGDRLMYRLAYRNFGDHESLVVNHSVNPGGGGGGGGHGKGGHGPFKPGGGKPGGGGSSSTAVSGIRWYEIRSPGGSPSVYQQGTYAPDTDSRWMGSIAMDKLGNIALGYSVSSSTTYPSIRYTGWAVGDTLGQLQSEANIMDGHGSQQSNLSRWGDYSSMSVDPVDGCTFWYTSEYLQSDGTFNWSTRIAKFKFPSCQ